MAAASSNADGPWNEVYVRFISSFSFPSRLRREWSPVHAPSLLPEVVLATTGQANCDQRTEGPFLLFWVVVFFSYLFLVVTSPISFPVAFAYGWGYTELDRRSTHERACGEVYGDDLW